MRLWSELARCISDLRPACSRLVTFGWMSLVLFGLCARRDLAGVTSFVRAPWLVSRSYRRLLHLFHSSALDLDKLTSCWCALVRKLFRPLCVNGRLVCLADGIQIPKEGRKMPAVKSLFNESPSNAKRRFIMGHAFQAISLLVHGPRDRVVSIPLLSRITEGVRLTSEPTPKRPAKLAEMLVAMWVRTGQFVTLVADSYYATKNLIQPLLAAHHHLVTRLRPSAVAYFPAIASKPSGAGRPRKYGRRVVLRELFDSADDFTSATLRLYDETVELRYLALDLLWRPLARKIRFVLVLLPGSVPTILMSTDLGLAPEQIIMLYGHRFKIETGFKQAKHSVGAYAYHFWMSAMQPIRKGDHDQLLDDRSPRYREKVHYKIAAYHRFVQLGCIAQGLLLHLSVNFTQQVWDSFYSWIRTIRPGVPPSEAVVAEALRWTLPEIFTKIDPGCFSLEFLADRVDPTILPTCFHRTA